MYNMGASFMNFVFLATRQLYFSYIVEYYILIFWQNKVMMMMCVVEMHRIYFVRYWMVSILYTRIGLFIETWNHRTSWLPPMDVQSLLTLVLHESMASLWLWLPLLVYRQFGYNTNNCSHWVHFTVLRCICVFVFSCISLHVCCIIVTRWGGPDGIEAWSDDWPSSFSALTLLVGSHDL